MQTTEEPKISVIIPVYNVEKYLKDCIESVLRQTYKNFECILIDDGSTDRSGDICDDFEAMDSSRVIALHTKNCGVSSARNAGLQYCSGKYVVFIDSDDYVLEEYLEILYGNMQAHDADISMCNATMFGENEDFRRAYCLKSELIQCDDGIDCCKYNFLYSPWGKLYKRRLLKDIWFDTELTIGEDAYFVARALSKSKRCYFDSRELYRYRMHGSSAMHSMDLAGFETWLTAWERISDLHAPGSKAYWNAKLFYLNLYRWMINKNKNKLFQYQKEVKRYRRAFLCGRGRIKVKASILLSAYAPSVYFGIRSRRGGAP